MSKKTIIEKFNDEKHVKVEIIEKDFADMKTGEKMFIASPKIIDNYINHIPKGKSVSLKTLRKDLAIEHHADNTCPLTAGIFLRIVAEKNYEDFSNGKSIEKITPFWRVIEPTSPMLKKLSFGKEFVLEQHQKENLFIKKLN